MTEEELHLDGDFSWAYDPARFTARSISPALLPLGFRPVYTFAQQPYSRSLLVPGLYLNRRGAGCRAVPPLRVPSGFSELALRLEDV